MYLTEPFNIICLVYLDIDECMNSSTCLPGQHCSNTVGSYICEYYPCEAGYQRNNATGDCDDIDECREGGEALCRTGQQCVNEMGFYSCKDLPCNVGYERNDNGFCTGEAIFEKIVVLSYLSCLCF